MSQSLRWASLGPPPQSLSEQNGSLVSIKVRLLDDTVAVFHLGHKSYGRNLIDEVYRHLNILEVDYFGLEYIDANGSHCWLERDKLIFKQISTEMSDAKFYFIVKFYTPNPVDLEEEYTRFLMTLQIKRDLAVGDLICSDSTAALLAAYLVQSECGDFSSEDYPDANYLSHSRFVPNQTYEFQQKVMDNHRNLIGMSPGESDLALLEVARRCDFYGIKLHPAKDIEGTEASLTVLHLGIKVYHQLHCVSTFSWAKIRKLSFKRRKLLIKLHPDAYQYYKETIEFVFDSRNECKNFWKKCVEHHAFFRCTQIEDNRKEKRFLSKGSSFKYHGKTQRQLIDYVREHHKRREPFTRPLRSGLSSRAFTSSAYATVTDGHPARNATHYSMPHIPLPSSARDSSGRDQEADSGTLLDARSCRVSRHQNRMSSMSSNVSRQGCSSTDRPLKTYNAGSTVDTSYETCNPSTSTTNTNRAYNGRQPMYDQPADISLSMPNVSQMESTQTTSYAVKRVELTAHSNAEPPKSSSGEEFDSKARDTDNVSEDSYRLSDQEQRSTRSSAAAATTFTARRVGHVVVKRVISCGSSTNTNGATTGSGDESSAAAKRRALRDRVANGVPVQVDGPDINVLERRSKTLDYPYGGSSTDSQNYPQVSIQRPKILSTEESDSKRKSQSPQESRGATGPIQGKVLTKDTMIITPEGVKMREKPKVPPKPASLIQRKSPEASTSGHPVVHMIDGAVAATSTPKLENAKESFLPDEPEYGNITSESRPLKRPALISVRSEDEPDIERQLLLNSSIPYTLTMRHVNSTESLPFSTFRSPGASTFNEISQTTSSYETQSLKREKKERRKSLDLVPKRRLPSPGNYSATDHSLPDGDVIELIERRRSLSHERAKNKRNDPRRNTQPVRFDLPMLTSFQLTTFDSSRTSVSADGSSPIVSLLVDDVNDDELTSEGRSLHDDMERLERQRFTVSSILSMSSSATAPRDQPSVEPEAAPVLPDDLPPPPEELLQYENLPKKRPQPPAPPPKTKTALEKVHAFKANILHQEEKGNDKSSPPFIDDSPTGMEDSRKALKPSEERKDGQQHTPEETKRTATGVLWTDF
ncbi:hypothetical protein WR25_19324 [Diploscapter pachys]|uniref:Moesin/ezrin/radixin homolog 1 n=1 Tax=Diploscapter pachys TaxID=2018661 RepID=A0A2A2JUN9_9BILA|nr:hypothetical protein WR25_19324 [Diploscapter pachys]